jgi:homoserine kinase
LARAPASSANLGPGFDTLAVALALYTEVEIDYRAEGLLVCAEGEGADLPRGASHMAARVAIGVAGHDRLAISVRSQIPVARGLGSSSALAVAAAAAAGAPDAFAVGSAVDGHPENAAAAAFGGFVAATMVGPAPVARSLRLDPDLRFIVLVPDRGLETSCARAVLEASVARADAVFNLGRLGLLIGGFAEHSQLLQEAGDDRLHQSQRAALFPEAPALLAGLRERGALTSCWSGAGPSLLGVCTSAEAVSLRDAGEALMERYGVPGRALLLEADCAGAQVKELS